MVEGLKCLNSFITKLILALQLQVGANTHLQFSSDTSPETVDIGILIISRNGDRKIMLPIRIMRGPSKV